MSEKQGKKGLSDYQMLFVKCVVVLSCIALISGLLLGFFSQVTQISAEERAERAVKKIQSVREGDFRPVDTDVEKNYADGRIDYLFVDDSGETPVYGAVVTGFKGYGGEIEFQVVLEGDRVVDLAVGSNKETPGISDNALKNEKFLSQFKGKTVEELYRALAEENSIDSATGSTYSSRGTKNAMKTLAEFMREYLGGAK